LNIFFCNCQYSTENEKLVKKLAEKMESLKFITDSILEHFEKRKLNVL